MKKEPKVLWVVVGDRRKGLIPALHVINELKPKCEKVAKTLNYDFCLITSPFVDIKGLKVTKDGKLIFLKPHKVKENQVQLLSLNPIKSSKRRYK